jgi:hypothetical protein
MSANTADLIRGGAASIAAGKEVTSNTIESVDPSTNSIGEDVDQEEYVSEDSSLEDLLPDDGQSPEDSKVAKGKGPASPKAKPDKAAQTSGKETITVSDDKGRRKVEIDWNNRDELKRQLQLAYGARKWQAERDQARQEAQQLKSRTDELKSNWDALEGAFQKGGVEGVIDLLEGRQGAYQNWLKKQIDRHEFLRDATPEERAALESREKADKSARELEKIRKENEEFRKQMVQEKEQAELKSLESRVHPVFDKYRFADKLGDSNDEHMFDEMLWNSALKRLEPYEEQGLAITPELIEREFRNVAIAIRKRIGLQAEKKAAKVVEQRKQEATENVQAKVRSGYKSENVSAKEARDLIEGRNLTGLLKNWGKYGGLFNK